MFFGSGGYAEVAVAVDRLTQKTVAVKVQELPSQAADRELQALLHLRHFPCAHVVGLLDYFVKPNRSGVLRTHLVFEAYVQTIHWTVDYTSVIP